MKYEVLIAASIVDSLFYRPFFNHRAIILLENSTKYLAGRYPDKYWYTTFARDDRRFGIFREFALNDLSTRVRYDYVMSHFRNFDYTQQYIESTKFRS